ncbi:hypothetical protein KDA_49640 [Dictyobacter alpinus]|uniref:Uncharacterized protein n=1 Tax=Dictyobacter alpinus TaxID=2014873 RepID=A0A402BDV5_9CHLR|nr:hypothetical protein KDA_49640 [Dictyobacter alpinus]
MHLVGVGEDPEDALRKLAVVEGEAILQLANEAMQLGLDVLVDGFVAMPLQVSQLDVGFRWL